MASLNPSSIELTCTILFGLAIVHTFLCSRFTHASHAYPENSVRASLLHLLGEVEVVFGFWAGILVLAMLYFKGSHETIGYLEKQNYTEPAFVFAIMAMAATAPVIYFARGAIFLISKAVPLPKEAAIYATCLVAGPLLGSFITEPAAMTVTALILRQRFYERQLSNGFMYATLGALFVNVSIGGTLTPYAAPPVLMVAGAWHWDLAFMLKTFGWKAALAVTANAALATAFSWKELKALAAPPENTATKIPVWVVLSHLACLALLVLTSHHLVVFMGIFLYFIGLTTITQKWQEPLKIRESLLVGFFLAGLVILGGYQKWWLDPLIRSMSETTLFLGATALTAVTDNAALTYLGSQVDAVSDGFKYFLVAGAVTGGGLTVIANAPNPAGFSILQESFKPDGISAVKLFLYAFVPTLVSLVCFWVL